LFLWGGVWVDGGGGGVVFCFGGGGKSRVGGGICFFWGRLKIPCEGIFSGAPAQIAVMGFLPFLSIFLF